MATVITNTDIGSNLFIGFTKLNAREQLTGSNYRVVYANNTPENNAIALYSAYQFAKIQNPNALPKSESNRFVIFLAPGKYTFNGGFPTELDLDTPYIDIVSLSGEADVTITTIASFEPIKISTSNIRLKGINLESQSIQVNGSYGNNYFENIIGGEYNFSNPNNAGDIAGNFKNCVGGNHSFGDANNGQAVYDSTFENCSAGEYSFGFNMFYCKLTNCSSRAYSFGANTLVGSTLTNCTSKYNNYCFGAYTEINNCTLTNCLSGAFSFASPDTTGTLIINSTLKECVASDWGFGQIINFSILIDCKAGNYSFGKNQIVNSSKLTNCTTNGGTDSFGCELGISDSVLTNCSSGEYSFGRTNSYTQILSSTFNNCTALKSSFSNYIENSTFLNCKAGDNSFALTSDISTISEIYSTTFTDCTARDYSFGVRNDSNVTFTNCTAGQESFGADQANGIYKNCTAGINSFGAGTQGWSALIAGGQFYNCVADSNSFGTNFANGEYYYSICKNSGGWLGGAQSGMGGFAMGCKGMNPSGLGTAIYCTDSGSNPVNFGLASTTNNI